MASPANLNAPSEFIVTFGVEMKFIVALPNLVVFDPSDEMLSLFESVTEILKQTLRVRNFYNEAEDIDYSHKWNLVRDSSLVYDLKEISSLYPESRLPDDSCISGMELVSPIFR